MIYYLNSYVNPLQEDERELTVAANSKIQYILESISDSYDVVNLSQAKSTKGNLRAKSYQEGRVRYDYIKSPAARKGNQYIKFKWNCLLYLLKHIRNGDTLVVYHSLFWIKIIEILRKIKHFTLILELNDFYRFHYNGLESEKVKRMEDRFFDLPDAFILANPDMLRELKDTEGKRYIINYGAYKVSEKISSRQNDVIRVLYSGAAEKLRGAAYLAASSASFLPEQYELHMACYGTRQNLADLQSQVNESNMRGEAAKIVYHGTLSMEQLTELMSECDIALSCHSYTDEERYKAMFSFPSKIPLNMGAGLYIVSPGIPTFIGTPFDEATFYFDDFNPESVAKSIMDAGKAIKECGSKEIPMAIIRRLDSSFKMDLKEIILSYSVQRKSTGQA